MPLSCGGDVSRGGGAGGAPGAPPWPGRLREALRGSAQHSAHFPPRQLPGLRSHHSSGQRAVTFKSSRARKGVTSTGGGWCVPLSEQPGRPGVQGPGSLILFLACHLAISTVRPPNPTSAPSCTVVSLSPQRRLPEASAPLRSPGLLPGRPGRHLCHHHGCLRPTVPSALGILGREPQGADAAESEGPRLAEPCTGGARPGHPAGSNAAWGGAGWGDRGHSTDCLGTGHCSRGRNVGCGAAPDMPPRPPRNQALQGHRESASQRHPGLASPDRRPQHPLSLPTRRPALQSPAAGQGLRASPGTHCHGLRLEMRWPWGQRGRAAEGERSWGATPGVGEGQRSSSREGSRGGRVAEGEGLVHWSVGPWDHGRGPAGQGQRRVRRGVVWPAPLSWLRLSQSSGHRPPRKVLGPWARPSRLRACRTRGEGGRTPTGALGERVDSQVTRSSRQSDRAQRLLGEPQQAP